MEKIVDNDTRPERSATALVLPPVRPSVVFLDLSLLNGHQKAPAWLRGAVVGVETIIGMGGHRKRETTSILKRWADDLPRMTKLICQLDTTDVVRVCEDVRQAKHVLALSGHQMAVISRHSAVCEALGYVGIKAATPGEVRRGALGGLCLVG